MKSYKSGPDSFNPWRDQDPHYDIAPEAPQIRLRQLEAYLACRLDKAKYLFLAEAVGYQGAKFSGVPLTSERILLGHQKGISAKNILPNVEPVRTSKGSTAPSEAVKRLGYAEPTATIVWGLIQRMPLASYQIILWNSFPFHPFHKAKGRLTNRTPRRAELYAGSVYLDLLLGLCPSDIKLIAIGEKAAATLGRGVPKVRHPANGGAALFREQLSKLVS